MSIDAVVSVHELKSLKKEKKKLLTFVCALVISWVCCKLEWRSWFWLKNCLQLNYINVDYDSHTGLHLNTEKTNRLLGQSKHWNSDQDKTDLSIEWSEQSNLWKRAIEKREKKKTERNLMLWEFITVNGANRSNESYFIASKGSLLSKCLVLVSVGSVRHCHSHGKSQMYWA